MGTPEVLQPDDLHAGDGSVDADLDRRVRFLTRCTADDARRARCQVDAAAVAADVVLIKTHRPLIVDVVATSDLAGGDLRELAVLGSDGRYVGLLPPRVLCHAHRDAVDWPCQQVSALASRHADREDYRFEDWPSHRQS